jgi:hypothetical protein
VSWIEIVDADGRPVARRAALAVPCSIGSALDNTLVVDVPGVSPYHARIDAEPDGALTVTTLGQAPGLQRPGAPERSITLVLTRSAPVAIGSAVVRLVDEETARPRTVATTPPPASAWRRIVSRPQVQWGAAAFLALAGAAVGYFGMPGKDRALNAAVLAAGVVVAEAMWAGLWAVVGRLRHGSARFGQHFVVATAVSVLAWVVGEADSWQAFLLPRAAVLAGVLIVVTSAVWGIAVYVHLRVMNHEHQPKHQRIALFIGVASAALLFASRDGFSSNWSSQLEFSSVLKPWPAAWVPAATPAAYTKGLDALEAQLTKDAEQPVPATETAKAADDSAASNADSVK